MKKEIDIYDFDKTIVPFDSGSLFTAYCFLHYPWCFITLPIIAVAALLMVLHIINFTSFKKTCFLFLPLIPKEKAVKKFWDRHINEVHPWFKERTRYSVVISASPDFLLNDIAKQQNQTANMFISSFAGASEQNTAGCKQAADDALKLFATNDKIKNARRKGAPTLRGVL